MTEAEKKAKKKYLSKGKRLTVDFYPSEADLIEQIEKQPNKQGYIKSLIRADIQKNGSERRDCLICKHSVSEPSEDGRDILHCFECAGHEGEDVVVLEDGCCPNFN